MQAAMKTSMLKVILLVGLCGASAVTPIEKVVQLLKDLQNKVEDQGAKEAAQYDAYSCFCKNQARIKSEAIEKSEEQIKILEADIADLEAKITENNARIAELTTDIEKLKTEIEEEVAKNEERHAKYLIKEKDMAEAIASCDEAVEALKASKKEMKDGRAMKAKVDLAQLKRIAFKAKIGQTPEAVSEAMALLKTANKAATEMSGEQVSKQNPAGYQYQSNDIIATIQDLGAQFREDKKTLDDEEFNAQADHDKLILGKTNEKNFKEEEKKEKEAIVEAMMVDKSDYEKEKEDETANKDSDQEFLDELTKACEQKAKDWDQRSKARAEEMTALAEATHTLEQGATKQYSANKKLVGLVNKAFAPIVKVPEPVSKRVDTVASKKKAAPSFLQIRNVADSQAAVIKRVIDNLDKDAGRLHSPILAALAVKVTQKEDHFASVRKLINDLISKLESDAEAEATTKAFCDERMASATNDRDEAAGKIEKEKGTIEKETAKAAAAAKEIKILSEEIAQLNKDILDANELRAKEKANNEATIAEAKEGVEAVKSALVTLKGFYDLVQTGYKPPKSDRHGETVADVAPETFEGEYKGATGDAKGIIGILEVVQSDFERTIETTKTAEEDAVSAHKEFVEEAEKNIKEKAQSKEDEEKKKEAAEQAIVQAKDDLFDAETDHENALAELDKLSPLCVQGEETYAERRAKRQEEIAALKEAYTILDNWKGDGGAMR